jgi:hypothetical protein
VGTAGCGVSKHCVDRRFVGERRRACALRRHGCCDRLFLLCGAWGGWGVTVSLPASLPREQSCDVSCRWRCNLSCWDVRGRRRALGLLAHLRVDEAGECWERGGEM